ncbi:retention module-containing protein [Gallaecimonas pentaromativorans]|uniref:retention module-containing protein n=1 Tax=Gallaecimonas pentaromativorans TaxID=584787 RepID=UPI003A91EC56
MQRFTVQADGLLTNVKGQVWVEQADGSRVQLFEGDRVAKGTELFITDGASFELQQDNGGQAEYAASPDINVEMPGQQAFSAASNASEQAKLQQAILEGLDPTQLFEASAAGAAPAAGAGGGGGDSGFVTVSRTGSELLADAGYATAGNPGEGGPVPAEADQLILEADNTAPVAQPDQTLLQEDLITNVTGSLLANDSDANGDTLAVTLVNGSAVTTVSGQFGTLSWTADGNFSYQLNNEQVQSLAQGETLTETFTYQISDGNGGTSTSTLTVVIQGTNDAPVATANLNAVSEDGPLSAQGNMITDDDGAGVDSDIDNGAQLSIQSVSGDTSGSVQGQFGTLVWNSDGTYSYNLDNSLAAVQGLSEGESLIDTFSYTLTDEFGATSIATLTITINGTDDGVTLTGLDVDGGEQVVSEANLADGSNPDAASLTQSGSFGVNAPDGLANLTINGINVVVNGQYLGGTIQVVGQYGVLTITGFDGTNVQYSYQLTGAADHSGGDVLDQFAVVVTDVDGSTANDSLDVAINDDVPSAVNDVNSVTEDGPLSATGNVLTSNDTQGADGASVSTVGTFTGLYGTLVLNSDGSYTYTLNNNLAAVQGLSEGETLLDTFNYSLVDGDGDTSGAVLTITINGA